LFAPGVPGLGAEVSTMSSQARVAAVNYLLAAPGYLS
jgi:hypothetical protein